MITYFLLCGYTPFDKDNNIEEMQAILNSDFTFTPAEYWEGVSEMVRDFIRRCIVKDPDARMTAHEALQHPWTNSQHRRPGVLGTNTEQQKRMPSKATLESALETATA